MKQWFVRSWYRVTWLQYVLLPLSWLFYVWVVLRRYAYVSGWFKQYHAAVPVIVVGNISVGGTGKTPLVITLAAHLQRSLQLRVGIVSRGYGGRAPHYPYIVENDSPVSETGDEALLLRRFTQCPVVVAPQRAAAVAMLLAQYDVDVVISDDGLQHYPLARDIEIAVIDRNRRLGNGQLLPAGPLREPASRLASVDIVFETGGNLQLTPQAFVHVTTAEQQPLDYFTAKPCYAVAGIGDPERFFAALRRLGLSCVEHAFPDHHAYTPQEMAAFHDKPVIMTAKDAVKWQATESADCWYLAVDALFTASDAARIEALLQPLLSHKHRAHHRHH